MKNNYHGKKILILGLGVNQGGLGAAKFFAKNGAELIVTDLKSAKELKPSLDSLQKFKNINFRLGEHKYEDIDWADIIIRNQALNPDNPYRIYAQKTGKVVETDVGIFLQFVDPNQLICVTGTKGKSTTSSLIYRSVNLSHTRSVVFAGNIGKSVLDTIPYIKKDTLIVLEVSSFQLEAFGTYKVSPKYAVITNIYPDHLNYYGSMEEYIESKRVIARNQTKDDFLFLQENDPVTSKPEFLQGLKGKITFFSAKDLPSGFKPVLKGEHNRQNMAAALAVCRALGLSKQRALEVIEKFEGVEFRLQLVKVWNGVQFYNDTSATGPDAGIQALKALPNSIVIAGGVNKNLLYDNYTKELAKSAKEVFLLEGDATDEILKHLPNKAHRPYNNLEKLLKDVKKVAKYGDVVLFSPAAASFNLFQNEFDRGRKFNDAVKQVFQ